MKPFIERINNFIFAGNTRSVSLYAAFITAFIIHEASNAVSLDLPFLKEIFICEATAHGVDVSARVSWMYRLLIYTTIIFVLTNAGLTYLFTKKGLHTVKQNDLFYLAISGIVLCAMKIFGTDSTHLLSSLFFLFILKLLLLTIFKNKSHTSQSFLHPGIFSLSMSFAFLLLFLLVFTFGASSFIHKNYSTVFFISTCLFLIYYFFTTHITKWRIKTATLTLLPITLVPPLALLSVELFFLNNHTTQANASYQKIFWPLFLIIAGIMMAALFFLKNRRFNTRTLNTWLIIPALLFTYVLMTAYEPVTENIPDMFEPANILSSMMRVFEHGQIPVVDFMSSHMLSEQWFGYIYTAIFGFHNDLGPLTYGFLNSFVFIALQYLLLKFLFKNEMAAVAFIFFFPFLNEVLYATVLPAILPLILLHDLYKHPNAAKVSRLFAVLALLLIWRIDTGVVAIIGNAIFIPVMMILYPGNIPYKTIIKGLAWFLSGITLLLIGTMILRSPAHLLNNIQLFYHYIAGSQAHGHKNIYDPNVHQFYLHHLLLPILALCLCIYGIYKLKTRHGSSFLTDGKLLLSSVYILILYLVHLQRGLVRHGYPEFNDDYITSVFYLGAGLFIAYIAGKNTQRSYYGVFYITSFLLFIGIKYFSFQVNKLPLEQALTGDRFYNKLHSLSSPHIKNRVVEDSAFANANYKHLKIFLDKYLTNDQTFLDLSNTSMLYYYCNRKIPGYYNQNLQNTIDDFQQLHLLKEVSPKSAPLVVFAGYPPGPNDNMDLIPNVMRYYVISEYIFKNYIPYGVINNKSIWISSELKALVKDTANIKFNALEPKQYDYQLNAEYIGGFYTNKKDQDLQRVYAVNKNELKRVNGQYVVRFPGSVKGLNHCYVSIEYNKADYTIEPYQVNLTLKNDSSETQGSFTFMRRDKTSNRYFLRLSNHYLWHLGKITEMHLPIDEDIKNVELYKDTRF